MKKMKLVKMFGVLLCMAIAVCCVLTGCGEDEDYLSSADKIVDCFFEGGSEPNHFWEDADELSGKFDGMFEDKNATRHKYSAKDVSKLFNGRLDLGDKYDVEIIFIMQEVKGKLGLSNVEYVIKNVSDPKALRDKIELNMIRLLRSDPGKEYSVKNISGDVMINFLQKY